MIFNRRKAMAKHEALMRADEGVYETTVEVLETTKGNDMAAIAEHVDAMVSKHPLSATTHYFGAAVLARVGRKVDAIHLCSIAIAIEPDNPVAFKMLATYLRSEGNSVQADLILSNGWECHKSVFERRRRKVSENERLSYCGPLSDVEKQQLQSSLAQKDGFQD